MSQQRGTVSYFYDDNRVTYTGQHEKYILKIMDKSMKNSGGEDYSVQECVETVCRQAIKSLRLLIPDQVVSDLLGR